MICFIFRKVKKKYNNDNKYIFQNNNNIKIKKGLSIYFYCCAIQVAFNKCKKGKNNKEKKIKK